MLTGMTSCTEGSATVYNLDVTCANDMNKIRGLTGVCPQHNVLIDELSCREHLQFFAELKGVKAEDIDSQIRKSLDSVDLSDQENTFSILLSGGQKRKLSLAIAIIGDPKVLFLDEPTSGMDPITRRKVWNLLQEIKTNKVILLTTHFMDEADILSDRKAIISHGKVKCIGSSFFLKQRFGVGYHLTLVVGVESSINTTTEFVCGYIPAAKLQRSHGQELTYLLPITSVHQFSAAFGAIEKVVDGSLVIDGVSISSYGISQTSLEEVFLRIGESEKHVTSDIEMREEEEEELRRRGRRRGDDEEEDVNVQEQFVSSPNCLHQIAALLQFRFFEEKRTKIIWIVRLIVPVILMIVGAALQLTTPSPVSNKSSPLEFNESIYSSVNDSNQPNLTLSQYDLTFSFGSFADALRNQGIGVTVMPPGENLLDVVPHYLGINITNENNLPLRITAQYNSTATHSIPAVINIISNTVLKMFTNDDKRRILTTTWPWPPTQSINQAQFISQSLTFTILIGMSIVVIAPSFAISIVKERQRRCRAQLRVSGISMNVYWLSRFIFDFIQFIFPAFISIIILVAFQVKSMLYAGAIVCLVIIYLTYIPLLLLFSYVISFLFNNYATAQSVIPTIYVYYGLIPFIPVMILNLVGNIDISNTLNIIFLFIDPPYGIFAALFYINLLYLKSSVGLDGYSLPISFVEYFYWTNGMVLIFIACLVQMVFWYFVLRVVEVKVTGGSTSDIFGCGDGLGGKTSSSVDYENCDFPLNEDSDVKHEREIVENIEQNCNEFNRPVVMVKNLRKEFEKRQTGDIVQRMMRIGNAKERGTKVAIDNLTFAVNVGEVFGLLGPNGAGKTTTLNVIIAETNPTKGNVELAGFDIKSNLSDAFSHLGYCPQEDPLWEMNTLEEHLLCFARIRGIPKTHISLVVNFFMSGLKISEHCKKITKELSGGTKRKLSYALSMISDPKVVLMDEPSTGLDPTSKRFLWDTISSAFNGTQRGAILTTHYMEEADALCTRVGIMVNGQLQCIGSTQHLKNKYGSGYILQMKQHKRMTEDENAVITDFVLQLFPNSVQTECFGGRRTFRVPQNDVKGMSTVFAALEEKKEKGIVEEYCFSQSTLEQVFLELAKHQKENPND